MTAPISPARFFRLSPEKSELLWRHRLNSRRGSRREGKTPPSGRLPRRGGDGACCGGVQPLGVASVLLLFDTRQFCSASHSVQARWLSAKPAAAYSLKLPTSRPTLPARLSSAFPRTTRAISGHRRQCRRQCRRCGRHGADLFDSNVAAMAAALVVAQSLTSPEVNTAMVFCYAALAPLFNYRNSLARIGKKETHTGAQLLDLYNDRYIHCTDRRGDRVL